MAVVMQRGEAERTRLRKLWRNYWTEFYARTEAWEDEHARLMAIWHESDGRAQIDFPSQPKHPPLPDDLRSLTCGARTRAGTPCKLTSLFTNGRCKLHGGASTGPTTKAGKAIASRNACKLTS